MTENDVITPINNDPMEKRNEFIDHSSYLFADILTKVLKKCFSFRPSSKHITLAQTPLFDWCHGNQKVNFMKKKKKKSSLQKL